MASMPELTVERLQIAGNDVHFEGRVGSFEAVDRVKELLRQMEAAGQVNISDARLDADQQHVRFKAALLFAASRPAEPKPGGESGAGSRPKNNPERSE